MPQIERYIYFPADAGRFGFRCVPSLPCDRLLSLQCGLAAMFALRVLI